MELLSLLGAIAGAATTVLILSICAATAMNSSMGRILIAAATYGAIIGAFVGGLIAYLQVAALYWFILPLSAVAPAALYLLVAFASVAVKALFQKGRCTSKPARAG